MVIKHIIFIVKVKKHNIMVLRPNYVIIDLNKKQRVDKMKRLILIVTLCYFLSINTVLATENLCTNEERLRLRELAGAVQITYELKEFDFESEYDVLPFKAFEVTLLGLHDDFYIASNRGINIETDELRLTLDIPLGVGETYQFPFYASKKSPCEGELILTKTLILPPYNVYSEDPLCKGHEDYILCQKFVKINVSSYENFVVKMEQYIASLNKNNNEEVLKNGARAKTSLFTHAITFFLKYHLYFLIPIIILGVVGIVIIEIKKRRSIL